MKKNPIIQSPDQQYIAARGNDLAKRGGTRGGITDIREPGKAHPCSYRFDLGGSPYSQTTNP